MIGRNLRAILFILLTLVAQNLSFADRVDKSTHIELSENDWKASRGYVLRIMESHVIDKSWLLELVRFEPAQKKDGVFAGILGVLDSVTDDVFYSVRVRCLREVCEEISPRSVNVSFNYSMSGTSPVHYELREMELGVFAYFNESTSLYCLIKPTLKDVSVSVHSVSYKNKLSPLAIANTK